MAKFTQRFKNLFTNDLILNEDSEGLTIDYQGYGASGSTFKPFGKQARFDLTKINNVIRNEPAVRTAVSTLVDKATEGGYHIAPLNDKSNVDAVREFFRTQHGQATIKQVIADLALYQNAFVEVVRGDDGKAQSWNLVEAVFMKVRTKDNGDILEYYQEVGLKDKNPTWDPEEIVHFKIDDYNTATWVEPVMESLWETVLIKDYIRQWLKWFFKTNQLRPVLSMEDATTQDVGDLLTMLKSMGTYIDRPIPIQGKVAIDFLQNFAEQGKSILEVLEWCNNEIYRALHTPPISVGQPNESGRSDGAEQRGFLYTRVIALQNAVQEYISELFEKSGFGRVNYHFGALDDKVRKEVFSTLQIMNDVNMSEDAMKEYLESQGVFFETEELFKEVQEFGEPSNGQYDEAPSRRRQGSEDLQEANQEVQDK